MKAQNHSWLPRPMAIRHSEGISYKPQGGEAGTRRRVGRMGPVKRRGPGHYNPVGARAPGVERNAARMEVLSGPTAPDTVQGTALGVASTKAEGKPGHWGRPRLIFQPLSRTGENPPYGILGEAMETSASFEARSAPLPYPTIGWKQRMKDP